MKSSRLIQKTPIPAKLALCIASALALSGLSGHVLAAGCSQSSSTQFFCDDTTIYYFGNPLNGGSRDYTTFDEVLINTSQNGITTPLQGWGVYLDSTGYKFKDLVINTTGSEADGIHSKNAGGGWKRKISRLPRPEPVLMGLIWDANLTALTQLLKSAVMFLSMLLTAWDYAQISPE